jgi:hypothetical protein
MAASGPVDRPVPASRHLSRRTTILSQTHKSSGLFTFLRNRHPSALVFETSTSSKDPSYESGCARLP